MIFLEEYSKFLLFLHFTSAIVAYGACIHLLIRATSYMRGRYIKIMQEKLFARILLVSYGICFIVGALVYPTFRVRIRAELFDIQPSTYWLTGLFEIKEHLASLGLVCVIGAFLISLILGKPTKDQRWLPLYFGLVATACFIMTFNAWSGWYLSTVRSL